MLSALRHLLTRVSVGGIATILWLVSVVVAIYEIMVVRDLLLRLYAWMRTGGQATGRAFGPDYWTSVSISNFTVLILAVLVVAVVVGTGEFHARNAGTRRSWKLFGWTFGIELLILVVAFFI